jgi:uncharacterized small protein (DUF1192 family)
MDERIAVLENLVNDLMRVQMAGAERRIAILEGQVSKLWSKLKHKSDEIDSLRDRVQKPFSPLIHGPIIKDHTRSNFSHDNFN